MPQEPHALGFAVSFIIDDGEASRFVSTVRAASPPSGMFRVYYADNDAPPSFGALPTEPDL